MRLNFKKVSAIAASALMAGMTMGTAVAANYPAPFVVSGSADVAVAYGTGAGVSSLDLVQAGNIQSNLQSFMSSTSTSTTVTGGDSKVLSTSARSLYYGDGINAPISSLTYTELGNVLADGDFVDLSGTSYGYTQTVKVGPGSITYGTSGGDLDDPALYIDADSSTDGKLYNYTLSFTKNVNVSDAVNVQGQKLKILGIDYVIGSSSTNSTLYLYGSGETATVSGAEVKTVSIAGVSHTVELVSTSDSTHATLKVDGVSKSVVEGSNYAFAGDVNVYVKDVIHPAYAGDLRQAELILGANTLKLVNGQTVKKGADETTIKGTKVTITAADLTGISGFTVQITAAKSQTDSIAVGESFTDPVFGGLKLTFASVSPALDSTARGKIEVRTNDADLGYVTFTSARAGSSGEQKLQYVYDNNTATTAAQPLLAHTTQSSTASGKGIIHVLEGENARLNDWIVVNAGDAGTILEVTDMSVDTGTSGSITLTDAVTGESQKVTLTNNSEVYDKTGVNIFGGTGYTIRMNNAGTAVNMTWSTAGTTRTVFPRIKLANGGWMAFLTSSALVPNATNVILPDGLTTLATSGVQMNTTLANTLSNGGIVWGFNNLTSATSQSFTNITSGTTYCNFNDTNGPALLYLEPKKWDDGSYGNYICVPLKISSNEIAVDDPVLNGTNSEYATLSSDTYMKKAVDKFGTLVTKEDRTNSNGIATLAFPSSQMNAEVVFSAEGATVTGGSTSGASQLGDVLVKDSEVSSVSSKNLIVVGGSCINSVAANVLGAAACSADFTTKTGIGSGQFLIQSLASPYATNKVVLLVSGYEAADTVNAATYLRTQTVDTTVGKKYQGTSATTATLVTTSA